MTIPVAVAQILPDKCALAVREITVVDLLWCMIELMSISVGIREIQNVCSIIHAKSHTTMNDRCLE